MKQRTIFIYCMTLVLLVGLISCEGGKLEKNLLINLPQLSEEISGATRLFEREARVTRSTDFCEKNSLILCAEDCNGIRTMSLARW